MNKRCIPFIAAACAAAASARAGAPVPDVLALDPAFDGAAALERPGMAFYQDLAATNRNDFAIGLFAAAGGGHWLVGTHADPAHVPSNTALVARVADDGSYDTRFGVGGEVTFDVLGPNGGGVVAAAKAPDRDAFYFAGPIHRAGGPDQYDVGVSCADADGTPCATFGVDGVVTFPLAGANANYTQVAGIGINEAGQVIVVGGCKIAGTSNPLGNLDICVNAFDGTSGAPVESFGTGGLRRVGIDLVPDGWDIPAAGSTVLLTRSDSPTGNRIFIAGGIEVTPFSAGNPFAMLDDRAFVVSLDGETGDPDPAFGDGGHVIVYDDGNLSYVNALNTLPDGSLLLAGNVAFDAAGGDYRMLLAELSTDGSLLPTFCGGAACIGNPDGIVKATPRSVAVRPGSGGDIVIAAEVGMEAGVPPIQAALETDASGSTWRAMRPLDYSAAPDQTPQGEIKGCLVDEQNRVWILGERLWSVDDGEIVNSYDITVSRLVDGDAIFASGFDG